MSKSRTFSANILRASAGAYGSAASSMLIERDPDVEEHFGPGGWSAWRSHLTQRVIELAAAVGADVPQLFVDRLQWTRKAFRAGGVPEEDLVASLDCLRQVLDEEAPADVRDAVLPALAAAAAALDAPLPEDAAGLTADTEHGRLALTYLLTALEGDGHGAMNGILEAVAAGTSVRDILVNVLMPVQKELGQMWHAGELAVAQEHYITAITERLMAVLTCDVPAPAADRTVLLAAVSGDTHVVGIRVLSYLFELAGWRAVFLGGDVPDTDIAAATEYFDVDLVLLSATLSTRLPAVQSAIAAIREASDRRVPVIVGGPAYASAPQLWRSHGADGYGDTADATLTLADGLIGPT